MNKLLYDNSLWYRGSRHLLFFVTMLLLFSLILRSQHPHESYLNLLKVTLVNALFFFSYAYITIFLLIPEYLLKQKVLYFILFFVLVGIALSTLKLVVSETIFYASISPGIVPESGIMNLRFIVVNAKDMTFIVAVLSIAKYVKDYLFAERLRKKLEEQEKQAQQKLMQSQFDPHFLFNTINNLYALSLLNPEKTKEVIHRIKVVLKYIIDESQKTSVFLSDEITLIENYIQLEKLRYGKRLKVALLTEGNLEEVRIPPMILFLLVENCFKHGSSLDAGIPWIDIKVEVDEEKVLLTTENSKPKTIASLEMKRNAGHGLKSLEKRLTLLYHKDGYSLNIHSEDRLFRVKLELKKNLEVSFSTYR
ncbi:histidine kinase [Maribellus sp. CM-23]|uniref:sensor histidine kinase n=1 Tax=Maribellus sp. CM-23 TaxID=2781026 RepID=UPI001F27DB78|nr:histidine kinase [Maribellus sp. CM-23]MCE4565349.1 histidine kinase [Maribellus sp. CM-23]